MKNAVERKIFADAIRSTRKILRANAPLDYEMEKDGFAFGALITALITALLAVAFVACLPAKAQAQSLGSNEAEFQAIKARVVAQIKGSDATVSEVTPPKFTKAQEARIEEARRQLALLK